MVASLSLAGGLALSKLHAYVWMQVGCDVKELRLKRALRVQSCCHASDVRGCGNQQARILPNSHQMLHCRMLHARMSEQLIEGWEAYAVP